MSLFGHSTDPSMHPFSGFPHSSGTTAQAKAPQWSGAGSGKLPSPGLGTAPISGSREGRPLAPLSTSSPNRFWPTIVLQNCQIDSHRPQRRFLGRYLTTQHHTTRRRIPPLCVLDIHGLISADPDRQNGSHRSTSHYLTAALLLAQSLGPPPEPDHGVKQ